MNINYYTNNAGKNLIMEYIKTLTKEEQVDALSVIECMEKGKFESVLLKNGIRKYMRFIFINIIASFILQ